MGPLRDLAAVFGSRGFRRLLSVRVTGQFADGLFQTALASYVLFSPERQADARSIAGAFAVLLLPYCVLGPFMGVFIDRWRRRQILLVANIFRAVLTCVIALIAASSAPEYALLVVGVITISANRLILAALGAAIPRVVPLERVVTANAVAPTLGTLATVTGASSGVGLRFLLGGAGDTNDSVLIAAAAVVYVIAGALALRLAADALGPEARFELPPALQAVTAVTRELSQGVRAVLSHRGARESFAVTGAQRFAFGVATVATVLLVRNTFASPAEPDAGLANLARVVLVVGIGLLIGAVATPSLARAVGTLRTLVIAMVLGATAEVIRVVATAQGLGLTIVLLSVLLLGMAAQMTKVSVDSTLQRELDDSFRGRTFSLYDLVFNAAFVAAAAIGAFSIPSDGSAPVVEAVLAVLYAVVAIALARAIRSAPPTRPEEPLQPVADPAVRDPI